MLQPLMKDAIFLARPSLPATAEDLPTADDLMDTLLANKAICAGMAANMIGVSKRIIAFFDEGKPVMMLNPELLKHAEPFDTEEGCLSLEGTRKTKRYASIKVRWQNRALQTCIKTYKGFTAQVIQHEMDHLDGILI